VTILSLLIWLTFQDIQAYLATKWLTEKLIKEAARMISVGLMSAPSEISLNDALRISSDIVHKSWQRKWNEENTGGTLII